MRIDLCLKSPDFRFGEKIFFFFHFVVFVDGFQDMADTVEKFDAQFGECFSLTLGGHDVTYGFMVVGDRKSHDVRHGRESFLKFQDGEFSASLIFVCFCLEVGSGIQVSFVGNGGPDEGREGGCHKFSDFCDVVVVESVMKGGEKRGYGVKGGFGGGCLFRISLVNEKFHDHVEDTDSDGVCDDNWQGKGEEIFRIGQGLVPCEEGKEKPEEDFQCEGIQEGPQPELAVMPFQSFGHKSGSDALENGKATMDERSVGGDEESTVKSGNEPGDGTDDGTADESCENNTYGPEVDDAAAGTDVPVGAAYGQDGEHECEYEDLFSCEKFSRYGLTEKGSPADEKKEQQKNRNTEPDVLDPEDPG